MAVLFSVLLVLLFLALEWFARAALLAPLPKEIRYIYPLDPQTEPKLEAAVRCFRFLKRHRLLQGQFEILLSDDDPELERKARQLERYEDVTLRERGHFRPQ